MALMHVEFDSEVLGLSSSVDVIVPQRSAAQSASGSGPQPPYPMLFLLHGGSDNHTNWQRNTSIERYVAGLGLVVVMPSVQYSFYTDQKYGFRYFTYLSEELPRLMREFFPVSERRVNTFAAGLSMGGYGAFKLGILCPDRFAAVASLSGSLDQRSRLVEPPVLNNPIMLQMAKYTFGSIEDYDRSEHDLDWMLRQHLANGTILPKFYQACGTRDHNYEINQSFHQQFRSSVDLTYVEAEGRGHDWSYWDEAIQDVLDWLPLPQRKRERS